ncbi:outer membrane beta-barrel protein [Flavivirga abyssicola]|uniref:outer membrane beta-barrel protein n=1 Tax=Flavivirga abyssicola TaxID=3063533 RepID=UPI0026DF629F|nr:outer membrane beta-barrel protein [Flavivirga sp. MEBiC07777]WVK13455.1 outer membrane beta-barrel protein [Flavivirga sp. MEBiC07777]
MKSLKNFHEYLRSKSDVSKNLFFILAIALIIPTTTIAQSQMVTGLGIKAGLNYNANGDYVESINTNVDNPDRNIGYHIGLFGKIGNNRLYFKPELVYTATKSDYSDDSFEMQKIDAPLLVGTRIIGPISIFGGPSLQYILDTEFDGISINNIENDFSVGLNFGVGFTLKKIGIDLRYERGFSKNEATFLNNNNVNISRLDTRPDQLILSLSVIL